MKAEDTRAPDDSWLGPDYFVNRAQFPLEELVKYREQYVAWSWDGTRIVATADTEERLFEVLKEAGIDFQRVVIDFVGPA